MPEHELWVTKLFNDHLAGLGNSILNLFGLHAEDAARPWANYVTMEILVVLILAAAAAVLRPRLSVDRPGKAQQILEMVYGFLRGQSEETVGHDGPKYLHYFATIFLFILTANLIGLIPGFESPTMFPYVTVGCALVTFFYYNYVGARAQGAGKYAAHFAGPMPVLAPLMLPIELISHMARPLSLSVRLFANMYAGEQVTLVFLSLTYLVVPVAFMGLHIFVAFLQAYVFVLLTMTYVGGAVAHEH
ncbi:MAG: F0F1 ATP synthase subunit A [Bryobacterales bacterium]|nr:F0F1 ATP synthase subunit A [Bryobacterales bacterium]